MLLFSSENWHPSCLNMSISINRNVILRIMCSVYILNLCCRHELWIWILSHYRNKWKYSKWINSWTSVRMKEEQGSSPTAISSNGFKSCLGWSHHLVFCQMDDTLKKTDIVNWVNQYFFPLYFEASYQINITNNNGIAFRGKETHTHSHARMHSKRAKTEYIKRRTHYTWYINSK